MSGMPAARVLDPVAGSIITTGLPSVMIGPTPQTHSLKVAAKRGAPFCALCNTKKRPHGKGKGKRK